MLFTLGARAHYGDVADLLLACHHRVREHLALARRIALAPPSTSIESIRAAATRVRRYFAEAFPYHQADEEEDLFPRLAGRTAELDETIARLHAEHDACDSHVAQLVSLCTLLEREPETLRAQAAELAALVGTIEALLIAHIRFEERALFPAIDLLSAREREEILARMRARRDLVTV